MHRVRFLSAAVAATPAVAFDGTVRPGADPYLRFRDSTATVFASDSLPPTTLTIVDFDSAFGLLRDVATGERIDFQVTSLAGHPSPGVLAFAAAWDRSPDGRGYGRGNAGPEVRPGAV